MCGKLTGKDAPPVRISNEGKLDKSCEQDTTTYVYSDDGLNLLLCETDSAGKTTHYVYKEKSNLLKAKYVSYNEGVRLREFYLYDKNNVLRLLQN